METAEGGGDARAKQPLTPGADRTLVVCGVGGLGVGGFGQPRRCVGDADQHAADVDGVDHSDCDAEFTHTYQYADSEPTNALVVRCQRAGRRSSHLADRSDAANDHR
jgi:hypothetical protein